jgi:hypothetical protein
MDYLVLKASGGHVRDFKPAGMLFGGCDVVGNTLRSSSLFVRNKLMYNSINSNLICKCTSLSLSPSPSPFSPSLSSLSLSSLSLPSMYKNDKDIHLLLRGSPELSVPQHLAHEYVDRIDVPRDNFIQIVVLVFADEKRAQTPCARFILHQHI